MEITARKAQGALPEQVELEMLEGFIARQARDLLQQQHTEDDLNQPVRPTVDLAVQRNEDLLVDQRHGALLEHLSPVLVRSLGLGRGNQKPGLEQAALRRAWTEHRAFLGSDGEASHGRSDRCRMVAWVRVATRESTICSRSTWRTT
jgi:hypothetical protein